MARRAMLPVSFLVGWLRTVHLLIWLRLGGAFRLVHLNLWSFKFSFELQQLLLLRSVFAFRKRLFICFIWSDELKTLGGNKWTTLVCPQDAMQGQKR